MLKPTQAVKPSSDASANVTLKAKAKSNVGVTKHEDSFIVAAAKSDQSISNSVQNSTTRILQATSSTKGMLAIAAISLAASPTFGPFILGASVIAKVGLSLALDKSGFICLNL